MCGEMNAEDAIVGGGAQRHALTAERFAEPDVAVFEADVAVTADGADAVAVGVFDPRQDLRKRAAAGLITLAWRSQTERLMGPMVIVDRPPAIERSLAGRQITPLPLRERVPERSEGG